MQYKAFDLDFDSLALDRRELYRALGYGDTTPDPGILGMLDEVLGATAVSYTHLRAHETD